MEAQNPRSMHPLAIAAAVSVILFSAVGTAALLGWIPTSTGQGGATNVPAVQATTTPAVASAPQQAAPEATAQPQRRKHAAAKPHPRSATANEAAAMPLAASAPPLPVPLAQAPATPAQVAQSVLPPCADCGVVESVREIDSPGKATGGGAIGGALLGGIVGHQMGGGRGQDVMTVLGAVGGAVAGNAVEKKLTQTKQYQIIVRMNDGSTRAILQSSPPPWRPGDKVRVTGDTIAPNG